MKIRKVNEYANWTTYDNSEASDILYHTFIDYINPVDNSIPAKVEKVKMFRHTLASWVLLIPLENIRGDVSKVKVGIQKILDDIDDKLKYLKTEFDSIGHEIKIIDSCLILSIWSNTN